MEWNEFIAFKCVTFGILYKKMDGRKRPLGRNLSFVSYWQKYSRLRCLLRVKCLAFCFYLGWSGSILQFRQNIIKVGSNSWLLICSSNITLSLPSYTGSALKRELNFCNGYLSLLYFCLHSIFCPIKFYWNKVVIL